MDTLANLVSRILLGSDLENLNFPGSDRILKILNFPRSDSDQMVIRSDIFRILNRSDPKCGSVVVNRHDVLRILRMSANELGNSTGLVQAQKIRLDLNHFRLILSMYESINQDSLKK